MPAPTLNPICNFLGDDPPEDLHSVALEMPAGQEMFQSQLQKLREEFQADFAQLASRLQALEAKWEHLHPPDALKVVLDSEPVIEPTRPGQTASNANDSPVELSPTDNNFRALNSANSAETQSMDPAALELTEVCFEESVWCMPLVVGLADVGRFDRLFAGLLVLLNFLMQTAFSFVLLSEPFMGKPFDTRVEHAKNWRTSVAHDYKYIDLADTSLVSRVCSGDGALILSTTQATLIDHINSFLGLQVNDLEISFFQPGVLLCMVCIILWSLCVYKELRSIFLQLEATLTIPKRRRTKFRNNTFVSMSHARFAVLLLTYCARTAIASVLLVAGILWLARTTSIEELMLNAVALNAILDVDEFLFAGMIPLKYQHALRGLKPITVSYSHRRSQAESLVHFVSLGFLVLVSYFFLMVPLSDTMLTVKHEMCGGTQNFVVSYNSETQQPWAFVTQLSREGRNLSHSELAVQYHKATSPETTPGTESRYLVMSASKDLFETDRSRTMREEAELLPICLESFIMNSPDPQSLDSGQRLNNAAASVGRPDVTSCAGVSDMCEDADGRYIRLVCGVTCGCTDPYSPAWYKVAAHGCGSSCLHMAQMQLQSSSCEDTPGPTWTDFWTRYPAVMSAFYGRDVRATALFPGMNQTMQAMIASGCAALSQTGASWCAGNDDLFRGLAPMCPQSCGCNQTSGALPTYCPSGCMLSGGNSPR